MRSADRGRARRPRCTARRRAVPQPRARSQGSLSRRQNDPSDPYPCAPARRRDRWRNRWTRRCPGRGARLPGVPMAASRRLYRGTDTTATRPSSSFRSARTTRHARLLGEPFATLPRTLIAAQLYGNQAVLPIPDLDRTDFLLALGANPAVSNGSVMTAPDVVARLRAIRERGGRIVVVDPRRTETAELADTHLFIRPGSDALLVAALVNVVFRAREPVDSPRWSTAGRDPRWCPNRGSGGRSRIRRDDRAARPRLRSAFSAVRELAHAIRIRARHHLAWDGKSRGTSKGQARLFTTPAADCRARPAELGRWGLHRIRSRVSKLPEFNRELRSVLRPRDRGRDGRCERAQHDGTVLSSRWARLEAFASSVMARSTST